MPTSAPSPRKLFSHTPLTQSSFSAFGTVIESPALFPHDLNHPPPNPQMVLVNQNTAIKQIDVSLMSNYYTHSPTQTQGKAIMNMFSCFPRALENSKFTDGASIFPVQILERHPFTTQTFIPIGLPATDLWTRYLVIVAPTLPSLADFPNQGPPDITNLRAFLAHGGQAVTYKEGTWHAPMVVVGKSRVDFVVVQYCNGVAAEDCQEVGLEGEDLGVLVKIGLDQEIDNGKYSCPCWDFRQDKYDASPWPRSKFH